MFIKPVDLFCDECLTVIKKFEDNCIDSIVTDPPYGIRFMSKKWDHDVPSIDVWKECLRILKPGGHVLSFGGTKTYHRLVVNIEDAGFEIRDMIQWIYASGMPKSRNISRDIDDLFGVKREVVGSRYTAVGKNDNKDTKILSSNSSNKFVDITVPATDEAKKWDGWGTGLKPACEPICLARKPIEYRSVAKNILCNEVGAINIDECMIGDSKRWPSNVIFSHHPECKFLGYKKVRNKSGSLSGLEPSKPGKNVYSQFDYRGSWIRHGDENGFETVEDWKCHSSCPVKMMGNKARFFYCSKAKKKDRDDGLKSRSNQFKHGMMLSDLRNREFVGNFHCSVKPTDLMKYLCRLVTPKDGIILDPFMGSGSTGRGAVMEGFNFVGIEIDKEYFELAKARIDAAMHKRQMRLFDDIDV